MDNKDDKNLEFSKSKYFQDFDYSSNSPSYGDSSNSLYTPEPEEPKRKGTFLPALLGAIVGGIVVAAIILGGLYFFGFFNRQSTISTAPSSNEVQEVEEKEDEAETAVQAVAQVVPKSVVGVYASGTTQEDTVFGPQSSNYSSTGSGFFVTSDGYIVTNQHVTVDNNSQLTISLYDGSEHEGKLIWSDANLDVAVIKIDVKDVQALTLGNSEDIKVGEEVIAVGNPLGLAYSRSVTAGIVSAVDRSLVVDNQLIAEGLIQTDAAINSGNSGGPLVNTKGEVIGINTYKQIQGEGMGFAIPINLFKPIIEEVIQTGSFKPVVIGITGYDPEQARYMGNVKIDNFDHGIYIAEVTQGSPAQTAGLQKGDIITSVDGKQINTMLQLRTILYAHKNGDKVKIDYTRDGKEQTTEMTLTKS